MSKKNHKTLLHCTVNGREHDDVVGDNTLLVDYLREITWSYRNKNWL